MADSRSLIDMILGRNKPEDQGSPHAGVFFNAASSTTKSGQTVTTSNALKNATVLSCVNVIAQGIAQLPLEVWQGDTKAQINQLNTTLKRPNSFQTGYEFKAALVKDLLVYGNSFTRVVRAPNGRVIEMIPVDPDDMSVSANKFGIPVYRHSSFGIMLNKEIIHIRDVAGHDVTGLSRVLCAAERIGALNAADQLMSETFANGVSVNYSVEMTAALDDTSRETLYKQLKASFGQGGSRRGGIAVLEGGKMSAMKGSTPADADLRALRTHLINEIAALFRVPASLVGGMADEKYSNQSARLASMYRDTFAPILYNIEQAFSHNLTTGTTHIRFDAGAMIKGDLASQVTIAATAVAGAAIMTPNEARAFIGLTRIEGEGMDELGHTSTPPAPPAQPGDRAGEEATDDGNLGDMPDE